MRRIVIVVQCRLCGAAWDVDASELAFACVCPENEPGFYHEDIVLISRPLEAAP